MNKNYHNKNDVSSSGYEDSECETIVSQSNEEPHQSSDVLEKLLTSRGYKGLKVRKKINSPQIDSDEEEVYLLRIPKSIDPKVLESSKFSLSKESKVKTASGKYYMKPLADVPEPKLFLNSNGLKKISPISMFQLEKFVETQDKEKETIEENEIQPTPSNLIPRHTIFGAKYVERINLQEEIQQKLQEALQRFEKKNKVSKHKKKPIVKTEDFDDKSLLISQILEAKFNDKRLSTSDNSRELSKKKNNNSTTTMNITPIATNIKQDYSEDSNYQCQTSSGKKKKKKKHGGDVSVEIKKEIFSEAEMPEIDSMEKKKKKKRRDSVVDGGNISIDIKKEIFSEPEIQESDTGEKKKKKKRRDSVAFVAPESIKEEVDECMLPPPKRRKPSILSSTVIKEGTPDFQFDVSVIESEKKKKKSKSK